MATGDISPPPTKRPRISAPSVLAPSIPSRPFTRPDRHMLRIFSWNLNGIAPFLQPSITSFFSKAPINEQKLATGTCHSDLKLENSKWLSSDPHLSRDYLIAPEPVIARGTPSLAACLKRWMYPSVVCLQEVKIAPTDTKTQQAVRHAVKDCNPPTDRDKE